MRDHLKQPSRISQFRIVVVLAAVALPAAGLIICLPGLARRRALAGAAARAVFRLCGISLTVSGIERLPAGACIVASNHASYLDGVVLTAALPPRFTFVIKKEMTTVPVIGLLLHRLGSKFVTRADPKAASGDAGRLIRAARAGGAIGVFPEGTFRREPGVRGFRLGAFVAAVRGGLPVAPIAIRGTRHILPAGQWRLGSGTIEVDIAPPIPVPARDRQAARLLRDRVRESILARCAEPDAGDVSEDRQQNTV